MKYVLFDLDGTLVDSSQGIFNCFRYAFNKMSMPDLPNEKLKPFVGPPLLDSFLSLLGDKQLAAAGVNAYRERYRTLGWRECALYEGVKEGLFALKEAGYKIGLATGKPQPFAENILIEKGIMPCFSAVVGSKMDNSFDDKGDIMQKCMSLLGAKSEETVMVGDRKQDGIGSKKCAVSFVGFHGGFEEEGELEGAGATFVAENFPLLCRYLLSLREK